MKASTLSVVAGAAVAGSMLAAPAPAASGNGPIEIQWWHAMGGQLGEVVNKLAADFNKSQSEYKITAVYKGSYTETLTAAIAAFRANQAPAIVQVFEVGTASMMAAMRRTCSASSAVTSAMRSRIRAVRRRANSSIQNCMPTLA